ncbi:MAG: TadE/TadG family type IV pilus assembly protein [Novosphingobium sp.]
MMHLNMLLGRLIRDDRGTMVIETAIVTPVLVLLSLGAYQISAMVAKQSELDSAAAEGAAIALASSPDTAAKRTTIHDILVTSTGLPSGNVTVTAAYRCNGASTYTTTACSSGQVQANFVKIYMTSTYTPAWTQWGVGSPVTYRVTRYVQYSQTDVP